MNRLDIPPYIMIVCSCVPTNVTLTYSPKGLMRYSKVWANKVLLTLSCHVSVDLKSDLSKTLCKLKIVMKITFSTIPWEKNKCF